jgi:hypothetical protein
MCMSTPDIPDMPAPEPAPPIPPAAPAPITPDSGPPAPTPIVKDAESGNVKAKNSKRREIQQLAQGTGSLAIPLAGTTGGAYKKGGPGLSIPT